MAGERTEVCSPDRRPANMGFTPDGVVPDLHVIGRLERGCVETSPGVSLPPPLRARGGKYFIGTFRKQTMLG